MAMPSRRVLPTSESYSSPASKGRASSALREVQLKVTHSDGIHVKVVNFTQRSLGASRRAMAHARRKPYSASAWNELAFKAAL